METFGLDPTSEAEWALADEDHIEFAQSYNTNYEDFLDRYRDLVGIRSDSAMMMTSLNDLQRQVAHIQKEYRQDKSDFQEARRQDQAEKRQSVGLDHVQNTLEFVKETKSQQEDKDATSTIDISPLTLDDTQSCPHVIPKLLKELQRDLARLQATRRQDKLEHEREMAQLQEARKQDKLEHAREMAEHQRELARLQEAIILLLGGRELDESAT